MVICSVVEPKCPGCGVAYVVPTGHGEGCRYAGKDMKEILSGFVCFYNGKRWECYAETLWQAKQKAVAFFKPPKSKQHMVSAVLAEVDSKPVIHQPLM